MKTSIICVRTCGDFRPNGMATLCPTISDLQIVSVDENGVEHSIPARSIEFKASVEDGAKALTAVVELLVNEIDIQVEADIP